MVSALEWAEIRALGRDGVSQRQIAGRLGINRRTVARALAAETPPRYVSTSWAAGQRVALAEMSSSALQDHPPFTGHSPEQERPLGGYAALMGTFAALCGERHDLPHGTSPCIRYFPRVRPELEVDM